MTIKELLNKFCKDGIDDFEIKKEDGVITIGYFSEAPIDCVRIGSNEIIYTCFSRQEKLNWLFDLIDDKVKVIDDYFIDNTK